MQRPQHHTTITTILGKPLSDSNNNNYSPRESRPWGEVQCTVVFLGVLHNTAPSMQRHRRHPGKASKHLVLSVSRVPCVKQCQYQGSRVLNIFCVKATVCQTSSVKTYVCQTISSSASPVCQTCSGNLRKKRSVECIWHPTQGR